MIRRKNFRTPTSALMYCTTIEYGKKGSFPIDQTPALPFNIDPDTGRPMSDIVKLTKIQDAVNQQAFLASLKETKSNFLPADMSDDDALMFLKPRSIQTRSQLLDWKTKLAEHQLKEKQNERNKVLSAELAKEREELYNSFMERNKQSNSKTD